MMKEPDKWSGSFFLAVSVLIIIGSYRLKTGSYHKPGPGFLAFWIGIVIGVLSLLLLFQHFLKKQEREKEGIHFGREWKNILLVIGALLLYMPMLEKLGFIFSTLFFMGALLRIIERKRWHLVMIFAFVSTIATYLIFEVWLQTPLPKGFLK